MMSMTVVLMSLTAMSATDLTAVEAAAPKSLSSAMKLMSGKLKDIAAQVTDPQLNAQSALMADEFIAAVIAGKAFIPDSVAKMPSQEQAAAKAMYTKMMDQTVVLGQQLAASLRANDNTKASLLLNDLVSHKKQGHTEFKN